MKTDSLLSFWNKNQKFKQFKTLRYKENNGVLYKNGNYWFCLLDGGDLIKFADDQTDDNDASKRWIEAVSMSMKALGVNDYLPSVLQSKSITKMLGNRMSLFYDKSYDGRNMLGLDWPTGYYVISHPLERSKATTPTLTDGQGMPILTNDAKQARIMRLSGSGTDLLLEYPEYVKAFNYSDQKFFKFFPIYITVDKF